jgi:hypothetical protein
MEIRLPSSLLPTQLTPKGIANLIAQLKPGQNLVAVVETQLAENNFLLKLADTGQQLKARSQLLLSPGQVLKLEVIKLGALPQLRVLPPSLDESPQAQAIQRAFREFLPKQIGLADLAAGLKAALQDVPENAAKALPEPVRQAVRAILDGLPNPAKLATPEGLKQAVRNSGVFLEAKLASQPEALKALAAGDFKAKLLALVDSLSQTQPQKPGQVPIDAPPPKTSAAVGNSAGATAAPAGNATPPQEATAQAGASQLVATKSDASTDIDEPASSAQNFGPAAAKASEPQTAAAPGEGKSAAPAARDIAQALIVGLEDAAPDEPAEAGRNPAQEPATTSRPANPNTGQTTLPEAREPAKTLAPHVAPESTPVPSTMLSKPGHELGHGPARPDPAALDLGRAPELKELLQKSEGALARVVLDQLASLPQNDGKQIAWHMDLPFLQGGDPGSARLKIVREDRPQGSEGEQAFWSVVLELEPPGLGTVHSRITLVGERVDTYFWTDRAATCGLIGEHLDLLSARFKQAGLEVGQVAALPGGATKEGSPRKASVLATLVDEKV